MLRNSKVTIFLKTPIDLLPGRDDDILGVGFSYTKLSNDLRGKEPRSKLRGIDSMISQFETKPKQASGYQTQWE
jgi:hypothetical protein